MPELIDVELELLAVADPVVIDADEDDEDELAELEPVDEVAFMCVAVVADTARTLSVPALELEDHDTRPAVTFAAPPCFGWQAADGSGEAGASGATGAPGALGGVVR